MDYMKILKIFLRKYFGSSVTIWLQSMPILVIECALYAIAFVLLIVQIFQIGKISRRCDRLKPDTIYTKMEKDFRRVDHCEKFKKADPTTTVYKRPLSMDSSQSQVGWLGNSNVSSDDKYCGDLANITPQQFVKMERERKLREEDFDCGTQSLSTLCQMVVRRELSSETIQKKIVTLKENLECKALTLEGKYLGNKAGDMSESLINMLENLITNSSVEKPLPFKGDITTLAVDAAELSHNYNDRTIKRFPNLGQLKYNCADENEM
ncbi:hypothetical protein RI129_003961 [Pyrocoelia pectoralis]|uniref:Uncharacterized protein n=1 Tax=Pyrocoelia pectoralis TaxID=417401 RepID=A0AAN7VT33_9COLE